MRKALLAFTLLAVWSAPALAWEKHESLMGWVVAGLSPSVKAALQRRFPAPCAKEDQEVYAALASKLALNPRTELRPTAAAQCQNHLEITPFEILTGPAVDDPDNGMDRDLADEADPAGDRQFMGGKTGPTSQGFRHMYFGGWKLAHPLTTFQVPTKAIGQAPERTEAVAQAARELLRGGKAIWGFRTLAWAMHFVQDLAQPFHSVQIPHLKMVPWYALLQWPPGEGFHALVKETTRTIANYHWAYEGYNLHRIQEGENGPYADCLLKAEEYSKVYFEAAKGTPRELALAVAERSIDVAPEMGRGAVKFFGANLKLREFDLPNGKGSLDYADLAIRPDLIDARKQLQDASCVALANGVLASRKLLEWALQP